MNNQRKVYAVIIFIAALLNGCMGPVGAGGVTVIENTRASTLIPSITKTSTQTITSTKTLEPTTVPELEIIKDLIIDFRKTVGGMFFLGLMKNNTDETMVLPAREYAFLFTYEDYQPFGNVVIYDILGPYGMKPGIFGKDGPKSNCLLYPHETGVIFFNLDLLEKTDDFVYKREELNGYKGAFGYSYSYKSKYVPSPDLPTNYHPRAENVIFKIENGNIVFEYDINVPAPKNKETENGMVMGFLVMYDNEGNILNILNTDIRDFLPYENKYDQLVHMFGQSPNGDVPVRWSHLLEINQEMLSKVDHIEMLFEVQYEGICFDKRYQK